MIDWTLFQCQTPHDDLIGFWWSFEAGNVFESKLSGSARNGEQSFWIWSPYNRERLDQNPASTGRGRPFMRIKPMVGDEVTWYLAALLDRFGFLPLFWVFVHPVGRTKSDKSLIPMWAAPAGEWCFEYINGISTRSTIIKNTFHEFKIDDYITIASWATILATILDRQSLVSSTTQDVEIHLLKMKMHQRTRLTTLKNRKRQTVFVLSWWQLTKWIAFSPLPKCQQVSTKRRKWKKNKSPPLKFLGPSGKVGIKTCRSAAWLLSIKVRAILDGKRPWMTR